MLSMYYIWTGAGDGPPPASPQGEGGAQPGLGPRTPHRRHRHPHQPAEARRRGHAQVGSKQQQIRCRYDNMTCF